MRARGVEHRVADGERAGVDQAHDVAGPKVRFPPLPVFAPEHFAAARSVVPGRSKQVR